MCMTDVDFSMRYWPKYDTYVGEGYKLLDTNIQILFNKWQEANGYRRLQTVKKSGIGQTYSHNSKIYVPGFHIFLKPEHARAYDSNPNSAVYKVSFTDVLAFGTNLTYLNWLKEKCVIARYMFIHPEPINLD